MSLPFPLIPIESVAGAFLTWVWVPSARPLAGRPDFGIHPRNIPLPFSPPGEKIMSFTEFSLLKKQTFPQRVKLQRPFDPSELLWSFQRSAGIFLARGICSPRWRFLSDVFFILIESFPLLFREIILHAECSICEASPLLGFLSPSIRSRHSRSFSQSMLFRPSVDRDGCFSPRD